MKINHQERKLELEEEAVEKMSVIHSCHVMVIYVMMAPSREEEEKGGKSR